MNVGTLIIGAGALLSFAAAVVPQFPGVYQLMFAVLLAHLAPYMVYAPAALLLDNRAVDVAGVMLLLVHAALVIVQRFVNGGDYTGPIIYAIPLLAAVLLLPLCVKAARKPYPTK